jgi:hypothetical protein
MGIAAKLDEFGRPAWIALTILGFMTWWPLGLAILAFAIGSGRMGSRRNGRFGRWYNCATETAERWSAGSPSWRNGSSGNRAFDEYRSETLRRLEEEQREFREFLDRLRMAKDKAEFDQFMADRRRRAEGAGQAEQG